MKPAAVAVGSIPRRTRATHVQAARRRPCEVAARRHARNGTGPRTPWSRCASRAARIPIRTRAPRRRTTGRRAPGRARHANSGRGLLSLRVISAEVFSHLVPISLAASVHPPGRERNRPQDTQNPAHRYSLLRRDLGVNPSRYRTYHMDPHGELFGGPSPSVSPVAPRLTPLRRFDYQLVGPACAKSRRPTIRRFFCR